MGAIYGHGGHVDLGPGPFLQIFNPPLTQGSTRSLRTFGPGVSEEKSFKDVNGRFGGQTDDGRGVITTAHPEPSAQVS